MSTHAVSSPAVTLRRFDPGQLMPLVAFLNQVLSGHRHWAPITPADFAERVLSQPAFDPEGLILAWSGDQVCGGVHALRPVPALPAYVMQEPRHMIAWLAVAPECRGQAIGSRLLQAAEDYLYYCPMYFAPVGAPLYGILEKLWAPWYGSTERMGISAVHDRGLIEWLARRGYQVVDPGDVSLAASLHAQDRPADPGLARRSLRVMPISERTPWEGEEAFPRLLEWGRNAGRAYHGLVVADGDHAVGNVVWYPLPDGLTAALASLGLERPYRGLRFGSYLLERALVEMANRGYLYAEVEVHSRRRPEVLAMYRHRGFQIIDYWVNLVKT